MLKNLSAFYIFVLMIVSFSSCDKSRVIDQWIDVEGLAWSQDSVCAFDFQIEDTSLYYNVNLGLRHLNQYPYQNLWIISEMQQPDSSVFSDTIQCQLADEYGVWYGKRSAGLYSYVIRVYANLKFSKSGTYNLLLQHGMRDEELFGISNVGIRVEQHKN